MRPSSPSHISPEVHRFPPPSLPPSLASPPMTPVRHAQYHSHLPPSGGSHGHHPAYLHPFLPTYETTSPFPCAGFDLSLCQGGSWEIDHQHGRHQQQEVIDRQFPSSGSIDHNSLPTSTPPLPTKDEESSSKSVPGEGDPSITCPSQWMPSKMRFTRKTMNSDRIDCSKPRRSAPLDQVQDQQQSIGGSNKDRNSDNHSDLPSGGAPVRVCSDCNTTKTPLWRSGPRGPKSLCNACGIRQRKARRAMAAAALSGGMIPAVAPAKVPKEKKQQHGDCAVPIKKRCKFRTVETGKKLHVEEFTISFGNSSAFHHVFPQDEKEAAMLLMALSCGLIGHG